MTEKCPHCGQRMPRRAHGFTFNVSFMTFPDGRRIQLEPKKCAILKFLFDNEGEYKTWQEVRTTCCPNSTGNSSVRVHMTKIRSALRNIENLPFRLDSCYGEGYRVVVL